MSWLLLRDVAASGAWNMALDAALLEAAAGGQCTLRLYAWDPPTLSFGRNEPAQRRYDRRAIERLGLVTVRRPTGGRAVWHHREVTYSVTAPLATFGPLKGAYQAIHAMLADALAGLGAPVVLAGDRPAAGVGAGACFASNAGGEVTDHQGAKVVGSAQVRLGGALLQHGSILLSAEQEIVDAVTLGRADAAHARGLDQLLPAGRATWPAVADAVVRAAARRWGVPQGAAPLSDAVRARADSLAVHYADPAWTWRR